MGLTKLNTQLNGKEEDLSLIIHLYLFAAVLFTIHLKNIVHVKVLRIIFQKLYSNPKSVNNTVALCAFNQSGHDLSGHHEQVSLCW